MKILLILIFVFTSKCGEADSSSKLPEDITQKPEAASPFTSVGNFKIFIDTVDSKCSIRYQLKREQSLEPTRLPTGLLSSCEFIRDPSTGEPLIYSYGNGKERRSVLIVTGGSHSELKGDKYMPKGCGTLLQKIRVFDDRVELGPEPSELDKKQTIPRCPSSGLDEIYFAS